MIAATRPTPAKKPRAEDLKEEQKRRGHVSICASLNVNNVPTVKTIVDLLQSQL